MFKARFFLSLVALGVSFGLGLLILQDFGRALATGLITFVACQAAALLAETRTEWQFQSRNEELRGHIRSLQRRRAEAYDELLLIQHQRDQAVVGLGSVQTQLTQLKAQSTNLWRQKEALSWNLAQPKSGPDRVISSDPLIDPAQQQQKQQLAQEVGALEQQRQQLLTQVTDLEGYRSELNAFLLSAEPQRQEVEMGSQSLRAAIAQLQAQITLLHEELSKLEGEILDRRRQKTELDQALADRRDQQRQPALIKSAQSEVATEMATGVDPIGLDQPDLWLGVDAKTPPASAAPRVADQQRPPARRAKVKPAALPPEPVVPAPPPEPVPAPPEPLPVVNPYTKHGIAAEWGELMSQLPRSEFEALRAIAQEASPGPTLKKLAEVHLTMPEMLIDAINERALDAIGDIILEPGTTAGGTIVAQEYRDQIDLILAHYGNA